MPIGPPMSGTYTNPVGASLDENADSVPPNLYKLKSGALPAFATREKPFLPEPEPTPVYEMTSVFGFDSLLLLYPEAQMSVILDIKVDPPPTMVVPAFTGFDPAERATTPTAAMKAILRFRFMYLIPFL